jgi:Family of unknown function (DUF6527)
MNRHQTLTHKFVEFVPEELEQGVLYISIQYTTASHKCCCGCGFEVVTPISPDGWKLIFNGKAVSLEPSIGNWGFACRSHYWITNNRIEWAKDWSDNRIEASRKILKAKREARAEPRTVSQIKEAPDEGASISQKKKGYGAC